MTEQAANAELRDIEDGYRPNSGTDGAVFNSWCCDRCTVDHAWHTGDESGDSCPIIMDSLSGPHSYPHEMGPPEWHRNHATGEMWCDAFEGPCACDLETA